MKCAVYLFSPLVLMTFLASCLGQSGAQTDALANDEKFLKDAKIATDGPGLLAFLRARTLSETERARLAELIPQLGARSYAVREKATQALIKAGRAALPHLKAALQNKDLEIARRAEFAIADIERVPHVAVMSSVIRLLAARHPEGALAAVLAYLPCNDEDEVDDTLLTAVAALGVQKDRIDPLLEKALTDKDPARRTAVAFALGKANPTQHARTLSTLLRDESPRVRYHAALALVRGGDRHALPVLLSLLTEAPRREAWEIEDLLYRMAGDQGTTIPPLGSADQGSRKQSREGWEKWWSTAGKKIDLAKINFDEAQLGVTLFAEYDGNQNGMGRVWLAGRDGKMRWEVTGLNGPNDARLLPGGRVLIAERNANKVTERDQQGKVLWEFQFNDGAIACDRLPNGNTLITGWNQLIEVTREGKTVWNYTNAQGGGFRYAYRLRNHHILAVSASGQVIELDGAGKELKRITPAQYGSGAGYWASVELLPNGRYLVAMGSSGKVVEIDGTGKILWEASVPNAVWATRLRNGHTLVANFEARQIVEFDRNGKEVTTQTISGRAFTVRRY